MSPEDLMQRALEKARDGIKIGQSPFGCAIAQDDRIVAVSHNTVWETSDITAHAEINALREACIATGQILLEDCIVATTCEPCPMCMSALHWARVPTVYFGASIADASAAGFNELSISAAEIVRLGASAVTIIPGLLSESCKALFRQWNDAGLGETY